MDQERFVFQQAVEGLLKRVPAEVLAGPLRAQLRELGLDLDKQLLPAYPVETWIKFSAALAHALFPNEPSELAHRHLGHRLIAGYFETFIGKALLASLKVIGPRRALLRTGKNFRTANSYTVAKYVERGPTEFEMWMNEVGTEPGYTAGVVEAGMTAAGGKDVQVSVLSRDAEGCTYLVKWS